MIGSLLATKKPVDVLYRCSCGCKSMVFTEGDGHLYFSSLIQPNPEQIREVTNDAFINGRYSLLPIGLEIVKDELERMASNGSIL